MPVEWKRPERLYFHDPVRTGDGVDHLVLDMTKHPIVVEKSKEFDKCNDLVKKLFTFQFLGRRYAVKRAITEAMESVQNHKYDRDSLEVLIANKTIRIRGLMEHIKGNLTDRPSRTVLNNLIQRRRRHIRLLRKYDYRRYEWLLEKLDLIYTPVPEETLFVERKDSIRKLTDKYCEEYKAQKLDEYRKSLEAKRGDFLRDKVESLRWMRQEEIECGVEPTISLTDIQEAEEKLEKHLKEVRSKPVIKDESRNILSDL